MNDRSSGTTAELWASGGVSAHREDRKIVEHPAVGPIAVDCDILAAEAKTQDSTR